MDGLVWMMPDNGPGAQYERATRAPGGARPDATDAGQLARPPGARGTPVRRRDGAAPHPPAKAPLRGVGRAPH